MAKRIGLDLEPPKQACKDRACAWHGRVKVRGNLLIGKVVSIRAQKTAIIRVDYLHYLPKYERYERRRSRIAVHNPSCINARVGEEVVVGEVRPLSKTKHWVILQRVKR